LWKFNGCPRCGRDVFLYQNINGIRHERCFLCGYHAELGSIGETEEMLSEASLGQAEGSILANE